MTKIITGPDKKKRCNWVGTIPEFGPYHDKEWGFPVKNDTRLFEKICLESFQSGLSWRTILNKRDNFRAAFHQFDFERVAQFTKADVTRLLKNEGIVRNRQKIEATINNAKRVKELIEQEGSFAAFIWQYDTDNRKKQPKPLTVSISPESIALAKELKKRGWKFVGPTTVYAFMQAMGLVNDHATGCFVRKQIEASRKKFNIPKPKKTKPTI